MPLYALPHLRAEIILPLIVLHDTDQD